jgi:hypothetical protein
MNNFTVKLTDGSVWRWGNYRAKPYLLNALGSGVNKIISSETSHCFLFSSGSVKCEVEKEQFKTIKGLEYNAISVDVHGESGCAVINDGPVKCWGSGFGMLGNGSETHLPPYELKIP